MKAAKATIRPRAVPYVVDTAASGHCEDWAGRGNRDVFFSVFSQYFLRDGLRTQPAGVGAVAHPCRALTVLMRDITEGSVCTESTIAFQPAGPRVACCHATPLPGGARLASVFLHKLTERG